MIQPKTMPPPQSRKVPMIPCPARCRLQYHPSTLKYCPITGVALRVADPAVQPAGSQPGAQPRPGEGKRHFWQVPRFWRRCCSVLLVGALAVAAIILLYNRVNLRPPVIPADNDRAMDDQETGAAGMVPIRTLDVPGKMVWIDSFEVSVKEYKAVMGATPPLPAGFTQAHPVVNVSFAEAEQYARKVGKRLCTEQEWKAAADLSAKGKKPDYSKAVTGGSSPSHRLTAPQDRQYLMDRSAIGAFNLLGNVREWIAPAAGGQPQTLGVAWTDASADEKTVGTPVPRPGGTPDDSIGLRCCRTTALEQDNSGLSGVDGSQGRPVASFTETRSP